MGQRRKGTVSIRLRLDSVTIERIDRLAGTKNRQKFIRDAIMWRLDQDYPPALLELSREMEELRTRVEYLERIESASVYVGSLSDTARTKLCRDELDRKLLAQMLQKEGCTTTELAESMLGSSSKRTTILNRINQMNARAETLFGKKILIQERAIVKGKRGAWWLSDPKSISSE
jgi:hypothetical protein